MDALARLVGSVSHRHEEAVEDVELIGVRADLAVQVCAVLRRVRQILRVVAGQIGFSFASGCAMARCAPGRPTREEPYWLPGSPPGPTWETGKTNGGGRQALGPNGDGYMNSKMIMLRFASLILSKCRQNRARSVAATSRTIRTTARRSLKTICITAFLCGLRRGGQRSID